MDGWDRRPARLIWGRHGVDSFRLTTYQEILDMPPDDEFVRGTKPALPGKEDRFLQIPMLYMKFTQRRLLERNESSYGETGTATS